MKRNAFYSERNKFPSLKNLVSQKIAQTLEDNPDPNFVQQVVVYVIDYLKKQTLKYPNSLKIELYDRLQDLELACGVTVQCPEFFFKMQGHALQREIDLLIFGDQNNARMKSRIQGALEEILPTLLPASLLNTIKGLILDRNYDLTKINIVVDSNVGLFNSSTKISREKEAKSFALDAMGLISELQLGENAVYEYEYYQDLYNIYL